MGTLTNGLVTHPAGAWRRIFLCSPEPASRSRPLLRLRSKRLRRFGWPGPWYIDLNFKRPILQWGDTVDYLNDRTRPTQVDHHPRSSRCGGHLGLFYLNPTRNDRARQTARSPVQRRSDEKSIAPLTDHWSGREGHLRGIGDLVVPLISSPINDLNYTKSPSALPVRPRVHCS